MKFQDFVYSIEEKFKKRRANQLASKICDVLSLVEDDVVLDVGAGSGLIADLLSEKCEIFALEPNPKRLDYCLRKHPAVKAFSASAESIPFPETYFHKLYVVMAFHHFQNQEAALSEFSRVLKHGGLLLLVESDIERGTGKMLCFFETKILRNKANFVTCSKLKEMVERFGFETLGTFNFGSNYFLLTRNS